MKRIFAAALCAVACGTTAKLTKLVVNGDDKTVHERPKNARENSPGSTQILLIALDGVSRDLLYDLLRQGKLPNLSTLLGGERLAHAYLDDTFLTNLPSTTMPAWVSVQTGLGAGEHGVPGNEYFIRERRELACPAPVSFNDPAPTLAVYSDDYLNKLVEVPSIYERIHKHDPNALIWVGMTHFFRGTDKLLLAKRKILVDAASGFVETQVDKASGDTSRSIYENLDKAALDAITSRLDNQHPMPDVLHIYFSGTDLYAHVAAEGPDKARIDYMVGVVDPALGEVVKKLRAKRALANRWVIVTADHGHTQVLNTTQHAIPTSGAHGPAAILAKAGFRTRSFKQTVEDTENFSAVMAYGGAMAYVYLADRSKCAQLCPWQLPPRYREDVLAAAEAFYTNNLDGKLVPGMKGRLDMIFVRQPKPFAEVDAPFEVYVGGGKTQPIDEYLRANPHPTYVALAERMYELAVGKRGERAGDILLLAHNGDRDRPEERFYFADPSYRSWHGSPSKLDSEIPLIVAHAGYASEAIGAWVKPILGDRPYQRKLADIIMQLRMTPPQREASRSTAGR